MAMLNIQNYFWIAPWIIIPWQLWDFGLKFSWLLTVSERRINVALRIETGMASTWGGQIQLQNVANIDGLV